MKRKLIKSLIIGTSVLSLLFIVLIVHIYLVTKDKDPRNRQLARIDFMEKVDSIDAIKIKNSVLSMHGVDAAYFNTKDNILVYSYNPDIQNQDNINSGIQQLFTYDFKKFTVDAQAAKNSCPVIDKSSFSYQLAQQLNKVIK